MSIENHFLFFIFSRFLLVQFIYELCLQHDSRVFKYSDIVITIKSFLMHFSLITKLPYKLIFNSKQKPLNLVFHSLLFFKKHFFTFFFFLISLNKIIFFFVPYKKNFFKFILFNNLPLSSSFFPISRAQKPIIFSKLFFRLLTLNTGNVTFIFKKKKSLFLYHAYKTPASLFLNGSALIGFFN